MQVIWDLLKDLKSEPVMWDLLKDVKSEPVIWDLLKDVKTEPEKYIGSPSLDNLHAFLSGINVYSLISERRGIVSLYGFREYICTKYKDPGLDYGYMQIIRMNSCSDEDAFFCFYELLEEFIQKKGGAYIPFKSGECSGKARY